MNTSVSKDMYAQPQLILLMKSWILRNPITAFFLLTCLFSWSIWFLAPVLSGADRYVFDSLVQIGSFGPAFAAWLVAATSLPKRTRISPVSRVALLILAYPVSLAIWWFGRPVMMEQTTRGHWTDFAIAVLPALIITGFASGNQGVQAWLASLRKWRVGTGPYLMAFLLWPALILLGNALAIQLGFSVPAAPYSFSWRLLGLFPLNLMCILFYGGGNEEPGWRGFAQPMLQRKYSPLVAGLILGVVWAVWHMPLNFNGYYASGASGLFLRLFTIPYGVFFAWMLNRSRGSLLPVWLLHGMSNNCAAFFPRSTLVVFSLGAVLLILLVIRDKMWKRAESWSILSEPASTKITERKE